jgi:acyl-CoA dehydrogenase
MENGTGFQLSEELSALRDQVRRIIRDEIIPLEKKLDPDAAEIPEDDYWRIAKKVQAAGMWCMSAPKKYGGGGLNTFDICVLMEEMAQHRMGLYNPGASVFGRNPPPVIYGGSEEQIQKYVVPTLKNAWYTFFAITEPSGGSDPAGAIQCRAVRKGDSYVLNGSKIFISHAHEAEWGVVFARTDPKAGRGGITCFIIHKGQPGFSARPFKTLRTAALPNEVHFEDCEIPAGQRLGAEGQGLNLCLDLLTRLRFPYSAANIGIGVAALRMAMPSTRERVVCTFGLTIETLPPTSRLTSVDLPALGAPRMATVPQRLRRVAREASGDPVDARGFGSRTARRKMAYVGRRVESRSRRGLAQ